MRWFRYYSEALDDPKVQLLPPPTFKGWINVLSIVNETEPSRGPRSGYLPMGIENVAYKLHMDQESTSGLLRDLVTAGLLEEKAGRYRAHNWPRRQFVSDDVAARVQVTRKKRTRNNDVTLPVTNKNRTGNVLDTETEEIQRRREEDQDRDIDLEGDKEAEAEEDARVAQIRRRLLDAGIACKSKVIREAVRTALNESPVECLLHCIEEAERYNKLSWAYVDVVRVRHANEGCPDPELLTRTQRMTGRAR